MWYARNKMGKLYVYIGKPTWNEEYEEWEDLETPIELDYQPLPLLSSFGLDKRKDITFENSPIEIN
jgi:hypothetical protein